MDKTESQQKRTPAYAPYESFNRLLGRLKEALPLPKPLDSSFWARMKFSGSMTSALRSTMVYLGLLTSDGMPSQELEGLLGGDIKERRVVLRRIFEKVYEPILTKLDLERATSGQLRAEFKALGADGEVGKKAVSFFLAIAREAGVQLHPHLSARQPRAPGEKRTRPKAEGKREAKSKGESRLGTEGGVLPMVLGHLHPAIVGLLQTVPASDSPWDAEGKQRFKVAFEAMLDVLYPTAGGMTK